ncbi:MAG: DUF4492 domain-containing protein [Prevotellaceae bacterium]|nr:DUF4492 domain-containing protein [Prevotellaceae bacterium]MBF1062969.1 DUF4492 domain-containing protein [Prevotellaceae bacterium]MBF1079776.1 DUF4492 domain-containing protein [Prevotellaceae bacterium]MBF1081514.1 DUF4492 domain-containing protein [Prevotellaceae bacterium]
MMSSVFHLYYDGFKNMSVGKTLWIVILIKLFIIFFVLKLFFFPNILHKNASKGHEADYVSSKILPNK